MQGTCRSEADGEKEDSVRYEAEDSRELAGHALRPKYCNCGTAEPGRNTELPRSSEEILRPRERH